MADGKADQRPQHRHSRDVGWGALILADAAAQANGSRVYEPLRQKDGRLDFHFGKAGSLFFDHEHQLGRRRDDLDGN